MEIYQLKVFLKVARYLSFTEAASDLNLTQPAVSAKIKSLEASLGTALFERLGRKIELTAAGRYLQKVGPSLIELEGQLIEGIEDIKRGRLNQLKIGCTQEIASGWLPNILFDYRQRYPDIDLQCLPFETGQQVQAAIASGTVDVGFTEASIEELAPLEASCVGSFQYCLMVASDHRLAAREWLSIRELTSEAWVFPAASTPDGQALIARLSELGLTYSDFPHHQVVTSPNLMSPFLNQGHYLGFASSLQFQVERRAKLVNAIALQEFPLSFELLMLRPKSATKRETAKRNTAAKSSASPKSSEKLAAKSLANPLGQLVQLIQERTKRRSQKEVVSVGISSTASPAPTPTAKNCSETLAIHIGTQNKTIQTVTAGLIIQRLGLLEHYLPRTGRYRNVDYDIRWHDFTSGAPIVEGLQSEQLDIGILGDYPLLLSGLSANGTSSHATSAGKTRLVSFVASNPDGAGNTVIVPNRSALKDLDDLRHRVIAVPFASAAHGMITRTLARANLLQDVTLTSIEDLSIHRLTPRNSQADGYAYFAPLHDIASHQGQFRRLLEADKKQLPTFHGVVVSERLAETHPDVVIAYLKALIAAQYWYKTTPSALFLVSNWVGLDGAIVAKTLSDQGSDAMGLFFPDTTIRTDWVEAHIQQLSAIEGNEALGDLNLGTWIQPELLESALATL